MRSQQSCSGSKGTQNGVILSGEAGCDLVIVEGLWMIGNDCDFECMFF